MINSAEDARALRRTPEISAARPPFVGAARGARSQRSCRDRLFEGSQRVHPGDRHGGDQRSARRLDEIIAVDGVDGVFVGPGDLSIALSHGQSSTPAVAPSTRRSTASSPAPRRAASSLASIAPMELEQNMRASEASHSARCRRIKCCCARRRGRSSLSQGADLGRWRAPDVAGRVEPGLFVRELARL